MASPTRAYLDMVDLHGTTELTLGQRFQAGKLATRFMQDYCYNANKRCLVSYSSGSAKKYVCDSDGCNWLVWISCRKLADGTKHMYVSIFHDEHHDFCTSIAKPTQHQIRLLPTFRAAVQANRRVKRKDLIAMVQARDLANLQGCRSKLHRAKDEVLEQDEGEWNSSFGKIPFLLAELRDANPGTAVRLEVDQHRRFLRGFLAFGVNIAGQPALLPILGFDGAHCKHARYNGVVLSLIGRDGNGQNVTMTTALVHVENEGIIVWFLEQCRAAGIVLEDRAVFCDRGKMLGAAERFHEETNVRVNLRLCTVHLLRNMKKHYGFGDQAFRNAVWKIQGAEKQSEFADALAKVHRNYGDSVTNYIATLYTDYWTVHANLSYFVPDPEPSLDEADSEDAGGVLCPVANSAPGGGQTASAAPPQVKPTLSSQSAKLPLFGCRSTNFVESENSSVIESGIRDAGPYEAFYKLAVVEMERCSNRDLAISQWQKAKKTLTPYAKELWEKERARIGEYQVRRCNATVYFAVRAGSTRDRRVDISLPSCSCPTFGQLKISCRHINAVFEHCKLQSRNLRAFHPSYLVSTNAEYFAGKGIELPVRDSNMVSDSVKPSPFHRQAGRRVTRRIASTGESVTNTYKCKVCSVQGHNRRTCKRHGNDSDEANTDLISTYVDLPSLRHAISTTSLSTQEHQDSIPVSHSPEESTNPPDTSEDEMHESISSSSQPTVASQSRMSLAFLVS